MFFSPLCLFLTHKENSHITGPAAWPLMEQLGIKGLGQAPGCSTDSLVYAKSLQTPVCPETELTVFC